MGIEQEPAIDQWYQHLDKGQPFVVVAIDDENGTVILQYFDGSLEEIDRDDWEQLKIEPSAAPENWSGPYDELDDSETIFADTEMSEEEWNEPLDELRELSKGTKLRKLRPQTEEK